jgi:shikimate kinase
MNIILIGFRCAGKTTVGQRLARRLRADFVDCDEYIETKTHLTIREIFDLCGESYFRMLEGDAIKEVCKLDGRVIATGGGAALRYKNIHNLKSNGIVFFLDVGPDEAAKRIVQDPKSKSRRPALTSKDLKSEVQEQVGFRKKYYLNAADFTVRTDQRNAEEVVLEIVARLKERGVSDPGDDRDASLT